MEITKEQQRQLEICIANLYELLHAKHAVDVVPTQERGFLQPFYRDTGDPYLLIPIPKSYSRTEIEKEADYLFITKEQYHIYLNNLHKLSDILRETCLSNRTSKEEVYTDWNNATKHSMLCDFERVLERLKVYQAAGKETNVEFYEHHAWVDLLLNGKLKEKLEENLEYNSYTGSIKEVIPIIEECITILKEDRYDKKALKEFYDSQHFCSLTNFLI